MKRVPFNSIFQKDGKTLTAYGFACGYVQSKNGIQLFKEHSVFHVQRFVENKPRIWETFESLSEARKFYHSIN